jgi:hypothetical protein
MIRISGGGGSIIKQFLLDPSYPVSDKTRVKSKDLWILYTPGTTPAGGTTAGMPMGLLMALTYATTTSGGGGGSPSKYELSVNTTGGIKRVEIP